MRTYAVLTLVVCFATSARAQPEAPTNAPAQQEEQGVGAQLGVKNEGWGSSLVTNLFAAHFDGTIGAFSSGIGLGLSYKFETKKNGYPFEFGFYAAPQLQIDADGTANGTVAALIHANLLKGFGLGFGYDFFRSGKGLVGPSKGNLFFTLGYGITNRKSD